MGLAPPIPGTPTPKTFEVRSLDTNSFDHATVMDWLSYCRTKHGPACHPTVEFDTSSLRVIDCQTATVVEATTNCQYIALSYVWGAPLPSGNDINSTLESLETAPKVIIDSIEVVKKLGLRYLWVDRYCIRQLAEAERHAQICQMDAIYASAQLTIIAAASGDPNHGLPGVNGTRRKQQPAVQVGDHKLVSTLEQPSLDLPKSISLGNPGMDLPRRTSF